MRPYIDAHAHIGESINSFFYHADPPLKVRQTTGRYLARMAATSIYAAITGCTAVGSPLENGTMSIRHHNEVISRACRAFPDRFPIGLALVELRLGDAGVEEVDRAICEGGLSGVMFHPSSGKLGKEIYPYVELASMYRGLCLLHAKPAHIALLARRFPGATFFTDAREGAEECVPLDNVWFELTQRPKGPGTVWDLPDVVNKLGSERIVFGSDTPYFDYRVVQAMIEAAPVDEATKDRIAYQNAATLIRRFRPEWQMPQEPVIAPQLYATEELFAARDERLL